MNKNRKSITAMFMVTCLVLQMLCPINLITVQAEGAGEAVSGNVSANKITYHNVEGADNDNLITEYTADDVSQNSVSLNDASKSGYTFKGWYDNDSLSGNAIESIAQGSTGDFDFYAKWEIIKYAITYNLNGGTNNSSNPSEYTVEDAVALGVPTRADYTFDGWYKEAGFATKVESIAKGSTGKVTLFAKWTKIEKQNPGTPDPETKDPEVKVSKITISGDKNIAAGKKVTLTAKVAPANATNKAVKWKTSNTKYASVNSKGVVTTKKAGAGKKVTVTATAKDGSGKKATYTITIKKDSVKSIKIKNAKKTLKVGKSMKLSATVTTTGKTANKKLQWTTSNAKYATVSSSGKVVAKKAGKGKNVTITAKATDGSGKKASVKIKIK